MSFLSLFALTSKISIVNCKIVVWKHLYLCNAVIIIICTPIRCLNRYILSVCNCSTRFFVKQLPPLLWYTFCKTVCKFHTSPKNIIIYALEYMYWYKHLISKVEISTDFLPYNGKNHIILVTIIIKEPTRLPFYFFC